MTIDRTSQGEERGKLANPITPPWMTAASVQLDEFDRAIIARLEVDARAPYSNLSQVVGLSADAVRERIRHLERSGVVQFVVAVNPAALGFRKLALVGLRTNGRFDAVASELAATREIGFAAAVAGSYDFVAELICHDGSHLLRALEQIRSIPGVEGGQVFPYLYVSKWTVDGARAALRAEPLEPGSPVATLDEVDRRLVTELIRDARAPLTTVAARVSVSYSIVRRRVQALLDSGVIDLLTVVNRFAAGTAQKALVGLQTVGPAWPILQAAADLAEVQIAVMTTGPIDALLEVVVQDDAHLADLLGRVRAIPGVQSSETHAYLQIFKRPPMWSFATPMTAPSKPIEAPSVTL
jgi:DNA-binding Lrp family transcriptional regulator